MGKDRYPLQTVQGAADMALPIVILAKIDIPNFDRPLRAVADFYIDPAGQTQKDLSLRRIVEIAVESGWF